MTAILLTAVVLLATANAIQFVRHRERSRHLVYMTGKLRHIVSHGTSEKLLVVTGDRELRSLLAAINDLLDEQQKMTARYQRTNLSMKRMLANVSHDLKTPLTVVLGYLETMLHEKNPKAVPEKLAKVRNKVTEIVDLIRKFFDLARLESGDEELVPGKIKMNEVCKRNLLFFYEVMQSGESRPTSTFPTSPYTRWPMRRRWTES